MIRNRLGSRARSLMIAAAVVCWMPCVSAAAAAALPVQNDLATSPQNLTAVAGGPTNINLVWSPPTSTGEKTISHYRVESATTGATFMWRANPVVTRYEHVGLTAGTTHNYRVRAEYTDASLGTWAFANATTTGTGGTTGTAPGNLSAVAPGPTIIDLNWDVPSETGGKTITRYQVDVSTDGGINFTLLRTTTATEYRDSGLTAGATRHYRVRALYSDNTAGPWASTQATTPATGILGVPRNLRVTADGPSVINLDWDAPSSDGGSAITGYRIEWSANGRAPWSFLVTTSQTNYRQTGLSAGTTRHYRVRAENTANRSGPWTEPESATTSTGTPPGVPRDLRATAVGSSAIELSWSAPRSPGSSAIIGYRIESSSTRTGGWSDLVANTDDTRTTYRHTGLDPNTTRYYRVSAINSFGTGTPSADVSATTQRGVPDAPGRLTAQARGVSVIELRWTRPSSSGTSPVTGYQIQWSSTGTGRWRDLEDDTGNTRTTYEHTGLAPNTTRHYRVRAISRAGPGAWSDPAHATTDEVTVPGAPRSLSATTPLGVEGRTQIRLTWRPPSSNGGSPITGYQIERALSASGPWVIRVPSTACTSTMCTYTDRDLSPNTTWFYRVSARNAKGHGPPSNVDEGRTNAAPPGRPRNVHARGAGPDSILLAWEKPETDGGARVTGYAIQRIGPQRQLVDHPPFQHGDDGGHFRGHGTEAGDPIPVPGGGDQQRGHRPVVVRDEHDHVRRHSRGTGRADGPGGGHIAHRPVVECAPQHRRRRDPQLPHRGLRRRAQDLEDHPPPPRLGGDGVLRLEPSARDHAVLPGCRDQHRGGPDPTRTSRARPPRPPCRARPGVSTRRPTAPRASSSPG